MNLETNMHQNEVLRCYNAPKLTKITKSEFEVPFWKYYVIALSMILLMI